MKNIVITGASTGIGYATTKACINKGYRVLGSVRKEKDAERLQAKFGEQFIPLIFDVTDETAVAAGAAKAQELIGDSGIHTLINNAGIAIGGPMMHVPLADMRRQLEVNVIGLLATTQAFLPLLGAQKNCPHPPGRIINISSVAGKITHPFMGPYCASKHAVEAVSDALRIELQLYGIDVVVLGPGVVKTPIWSKAEDFDLSKYEQTDYAASGARVKKFMLKMSNMGYEQSDFGQIILKIIETRQAKARYPLVYGKFRNWTVPRLIPTRTLNRIIGKKLGFIK
jgi:NAD(P)-dependent dehydrogenase (short-subunit alcohol dehydrogenase family)